MLGIHSAKGATYPGHSPQTWLPPQPALGLRARGEGEGLDHPGKAVSQRPWDRMGGTLEGRHRGGPRTERQTPETNKGTIPGTGEETEGPQRQAGELETPTERRERGDERKTPYSQREGNGTRSEEHTV